MTPLQIKKALEKANFDMSHVKEVGKDELTIYAKNKKGEFSKNMTDKSRRLAEKIVGFRGGYRTGYGAWVIQKGYQDDGEWCDTSSRCHY